MKLTSDQYRAWLDSQRAAMVFRVYRDNASCIECWAIDGKGERTVLGLDHCDGMWTVFVEALPELGDGARQRADFEWRKREAGIRTKVLADLVKQYGAEGAATVMSALRALFEQAFMAGVAMSTPTIPIVVDEEQQPRGG